MWFLVLTGIAAAAVAAVLYVPPLGKAAAERYHSRAAPARAEKYRSLAPPGRAAEAAADDLARRLKLTLFGIAGGFCICLYLYVSKTEDEAVERFLRPDFGSGDRAATVRLKKGGRETDITLNVAEVSPSDDEVALFFGEAAERLFADALGENVSYDHVDRDLDLRSDAMSGAEVIWSISDMSYINIFGDLEEDIPGSGERVTLTACISYAGFERRFSKEAVLYPRQEMLSEEEELRRFVKERITVDDEYLYLPQEREGEKIGYVIPGEDLFPAAAAITAALAVILWLASSDRLDSAYRKRDSELSADYPAIVSELNVFLAAGLPVTAAFKRSAEEYRARLSSGGRRTAGYEELRLAADSMAGTGRLENSILSFGQRCGSGRYRKLSVMLAESMKRGSGRLTEYMDRESREAFRLRKEAAKEAGERAQAKLMIPSFMLFALVIAMVIYPAWSGM